MLPVDFCDSLLPPEQYGGSVSRISGLLPSSSRARSSGPVSYTHLINSEKSSQRHLCDDRPEAYLMTTDICAVAYEGDTENAVSYTHLKGYGNVLSISRSGNELHPTQKPVELLEKLVDNTDFATGVSSMM